MLQNQQRDATNAGEEKDEIVTREKGEVGQRRKGLGKEEEVRKWARRISSRNGEMWDRENKRLKKEDTKVVLLSYRFITGI